jgi:peptidoglycan/LPS O-acetylase OafA/YrhL
MLRRMTRPGGLDSGLAGGLDDRFPALDGCRAVAALGVLVNHVGVLSGYNGRNPELGQFIARADVGVSIFFVLSGFLLWRPIVVDRLTGAPGRDVGTYLRRRFLRIFPAYWFALTIVAFVLRAPAFSEPHSIVAHYLLLQVYDPNQVVGGPIQQSWTLATEISFYLFLPVWAWVMSGRRVGAVASTPQRRLQVELVGVAALWLFAMSLKVGVLAAGMNGTLFGQVNTWLPFRLDEFALGMGLAVVSAWWSTGGRRVPDLLRRNVVTVASWAVGAAVFWVTCTQLDLPLSPILTGRQALEMRALYSFAALFLILPAVFTAARPGPARGLLANRLAVWLGLISYGIYLWHEAFQDLYLRWSGQLPLQASFVRMFAVTLALSLVAGAVSWYLVERPTISWGRRAGLPRVRPGDPPPPGSGSQSLSQTGVGSGRPTTDS